MRRLRGGVIPDEILAIFGAQPEQEAEEAPLVLGLDADRLVASELRKTLADVRAGRDEGLTAGGAQLPVTWKTDFRYEAMVPALRGELPVLVDANTVQQMRDAIRFADSVKVKIIIRGARDGWQFADTLAAKGVPVIVGPLTGVPAANEPYDLVYANPGVMVKAGVTLAFQSSSASSARDLVYTAGLATAFGLEPDDALRAITINPARMFGVEKEYGSLEVGKWGNVIMTTGDPMDIRETVKEVFVKGQRMAFNDRHTELYNLYRARPKPPE